ncbi:branched-chain amino acid transaminase [Cystobacter fuscus]|uniref:branched-chain amino acid transaminase n=1 Tax=Cystobacter fuscus TaxID=43 RepID=UPI002B31FDEF|nr:branched-chain amino acid transaminase [Cystobacter fuscus]
MIEKTQALWLDGVLTGWDDGTTHLMTHTLHYGFGVFEGIRAYQQADGGTALFRLEEHIERLFASASAAFLEVPFDRATLLGACKEVVRANGLRDAYLRPLVFVSEPNIIFAHWLNRVRVAVIAFPWVGYSDRSQQEGTNAKFSPYVRPKAHAAFYKAKMCGHYALSVVAYSEAIRTGFKQAIFLDEDGMVCETTGENLFMVKEQVVVTPPSSRSILMGLTRDAVMTLARELGYRVEERDISREECLSADEIFTTGTASELLPVRMLEGRPVGTGQLGPVTAVVQQAFSAAARGRAARYKHWLATL